MKRRSFLAMLAALFLPREKTYPYPAKFTWRVNLRETNEQEWELVEKLIRDGQIEFGNQTKSGDLRRALSPALRAPLAGGLQLTWFTWKHI